MGKLKPSLLYDLLLVILFTYGAFYSSYKFGRPDLGNHDFARYEKMVDSPFNLSATRAPFVLRQLPTAIAYGIEKAGIFYPNKISFADSVYNKASNSQQVYFALIFSNYIAVVVALTLLIRYIRKKVPGQPNVHYTVLALCLGYFMLTLNIIAPLTQGYGWLAMVLLSIGLLEKKYRPVLTGTLIAMFSRETVLLFFIIFSAGYWFYERRQHAPATFVRNIVLILLAGLVILLLIRTGLTEGNARQLSITYLISQSVHSFFTYNYLFQSILTQGLLFYLAWALYKARRPLAIVYGIGCLFIMLIGGAGVGRILGESYPLLVILYCLYGQSANAKSIA